MKTLHLLVLSAVLLLSSCGSEVVRRAKLSAADAVGKHSKEFLETQSLKVLGDSEFKALACAEEAVLVGEKFRSAADDLLKNERQQESTMQKSISGDLAGLGCDFVLKQVAGAVFAGQFNDYKCAQAVFGDGMEKVSDLLCPYIKSKVE